MHIQFKLNNDKIAYYEPAEVQSCTKNIIVKFLYRIHNKWSCAAHIIQS